MRNDKTELGLSPLTIAEMQSHRFPGETELSVRALGAEPRAPRPAPRSSELSGLEVLGLIIIFLILLALFVL